MLNELSVSPLSVNRYHANDKMAQFAKTVSEARRIGFRRIRSDLHSNNIGLADEYSLYDWLNNKNISKAYRDFLYGMIVQPFIKDEDEDIAGQYIEANFYFEDIDHDHSKTECLGLAAAYLYETLSISFASAPVWCKTKLFLLIEEDHISSTEQVFNVYSRESFEDADLAAFVESLGELELIETDIDPSDKSTHLADHHGKAELKALCERIKNSPYVIEMRSTDWGGNCFIRKVYRDGVIVIVLIKTERRYALWIRTTGRNYRETAAIAEILKERYS